MKKLIVISMVALSFNAFADQCQWVTAASAKKAVSLIKKSNKTAGGVLSFCQPCGDTKIQEITVNQIDVTNTGDKVLSKEVAINGQSIDLAYTFVYTGYGKFENLAKLSKCEASDVSAVINMKLTSDGEVHYTPGPISN